MSIEDTNKQNNKHANNHHNKQPKQEYWNFSAKDDRST